MTTDLWPGWKGRPERAVRKMVKNIRKLALLGFGSVLQSLSSKKMTA